jgi:hypothetical protein
MATKKPAAKASAKPAAKAPAKKPAKTDYPKDDGPVSKKTAQKVQESAPKAKKPTKVKTEVFDVKPEEPGVHVGNYSVRTVHPSGKVDFSIDWDKLREHMKTV